MMDMKLKWRLLRFTVCLCVLLTTVIAFGNVLARRSLTDSGEGFLLVKPAFAQASSVIALDNFESGNWVGGSGWLDGWKISNDRGYGYPTTTPLDEPQEGSYHLKLRRYQWLKRPVDLSGKSNLRLQFWAKSSITKDSAECHVSPEGTNWYAVKAWTNEMGYRFVDIDLSPYKMSSEFYVRFRCDDFSSGYLYIDDLKIVQGTPTPATTTTPVSSPTPAQTTTPAASSPTALQPELTPGQPYVDLYGHKTDVSVGEEIIIYLSAVNPIISPGPLLVQLTLRIPSGWSIISSGFGNVVGGMSTNTYEIEQGPNTKAIEVHILANEPYKGNVTGYMDYYFKGEESKYHNETTLPVTASLARPSPESANTPAPATTNEGKGLSGTAIAIIIGVSTATMGGVLARVIYMRMTAPVPVTSGISDEFRPPPQKERSIKPQSKSKKNDTLDPNRIPEEKVLDIVEGQKGISYERLFSPYIRGATSITIHDPYIHAPYQISNFIDFCEILDMQEEGTIKVKLVTTHDDFPESQQEKKLNELRMGLLNDRIEIDIEFDQTLHDRWIETDTGWRIMLGRGLDIFQSGIEFSDQGKRKCKATTITYTRTRKAV
jgi:hypothetical protein